MKISRIVHEGEAGAAQALRELLEQVSTVQLRDLRIVTPAFGRGSGIVAKIDALGCSHTLTCKLAGSQMPSVHAALAELLTDAAVLGGDATPVLIAPYLSPQVQALCKRSNTGFLDLEGNARLVFGEIFIVRRSLPVPSAQSSELSQHGAEQSSLRPFPPLPARIPFEVHSSTASN
jgi:hypothetical protein